MFVAGPPPADGGPGVRLVRLSRRACDRTSPLAFDPQLRVFLADMVAPYGLPLREDLLTQGAGQSFGELAEPLLAEAVGPDEPVDLLVLAFAMHDIRLGRATATYLSHRCPGRPLAFALCDQGNAAAFTGIRLIEAYVRSGAARRALLLVAEQSALHYEPAGPAPIPDRHAAVCLRFEADDTASPESVWQRTNVPAGRAHAELAELAGAHPGPVIVGPGLAGVPGAIVADAGAPYTGVWWELAGRMPAAEPVLVADHDAGLGYLSVFSETMVVRTCSTVTLA